MVQLKVACSIRPAIGSFHNVAHSPQPMALCSANIRAEVV
jgi:hypothetical protein